MSTIESESAAQSPDEVVGAARDRDLQRAAGTGRLILAGSERGTRIVEAFQKAPVRVLFPHSEGAHAAEAVFINTAGGIAGGDRLEYSVIAGEGASFLVTAQAAEKVYRALDAPARVATSLRVSDGAELAWLPQETILFDGARLRRATDIELSSGAELLALEWIVMGRAAHGERMRCGEISDSWRVRRDGRLVWADCFRVTGDVFAQSSRAALLADCNAIATLLYFGAGAETRLPHIRDLLAQLPCRCGATLVAGLIVMRFAAPASAELRRALRIFLQEFEREQNSGPFRVPRMWSC